MSLNTLEAVFDDFILNVIGITLHGCKQRSSVLDLEKEVVRYDLPTVLAGHFSGVLYWEIKNGQIVQYVSVAVRIGNLENCTDVDGLIRHAMAFNFDIYDPIKLSVSDGCLVLSLRGRADLIALDYWKELIQVIHNLGQEYAAYVSNQFGLTPFLQSNLLNSNRQ